jgi:hypothetical protein
LGNQTDLLVKRVLGYVSDVGAVDQDLTALRFVVAEDQPDEAGFSGARESDQADPLTGLDDDAQPVEYPLSRHIAEPDIAEFDPSARYSQWLCLWRINDVMGSDDGGDAVADIAHIFEELQKAAAEIAGITDDQKRQSGAHREVADPDQTLVPEPQGEVYRAYLQGSRGYELKPAHPLHVPESPAPGFDLRFEITVEIIPLVTQSGEQFDIQDISHGVDDFAVHLAAGFGISLSVRTAAFGQPERYAYVDQHPGRYEPSEIIVSSQQQRDGHGEYDSDRPEIEENRPSGMIDAHGGFGDPVRECAGKMPAEIPDGMVLQVGVQYLRCPFAQARSHHDQTGAAGPAEQDFGDIQCGEKHQGRFQALRQGNRITACLRYAIDDLPDGVGYEDVAHGLSRFQNQHQQKPSTKPRHTVNNEANAGIRQSGGVSCAFKSEPCRIVHDEGSVFGETVAAVSFRATQALSIRTSPENLVDYCFWGKRTTLSRKSQDRRC